MKITVEKRHLDKAIKAVAGKDYYADNNITVCCPVAQAAKEQLGDQFISMGMSRIKFKEKGVIKDLTCDEARKITDLAWGDSIVKNKKEIEVMLPITLEFV